MTLRLLPQTRFRQLTPAIGPLMSSDQDDSLTSFIDILEQDKLIFKDDRELLKWSLDVLKNSNDPDELICSQTKTLCRSDLKFTTDGKFNSNLA